MSPDPVIDYLDTPPQRWHQLGANGAFIERDDGEWMKFEDVDLYMFEGGQLMRRMLEEHKRLREALDSFVKIADEAATQWDNDNDTRVGKMLLAMAGRAPRYRADIDAIHEVRKGAVTRKSEHE